MLMRNHHGRFVTTYQVRSFLSPGYGKYDTVVNAEKGFLHTGMNPLKPDIFPEQFCP